MLHGAPTPKHFGIFCGKENVTGSFCENQNVRLNQTGRQFRLHYVRVTTDTVEVTCNYRPSLGQDLSLGAVDARTLQDYVPENQRLVSDNRHQSPLGFSGLQTLAVCQDARADERMTEFVNATVSMVNICFNNRSQLFCGCSADECCGRSLQNTRYVLSAQSPSTSTVKVCQK